jgi:D-alanyl-D-alanine carboxypeptidase
MELLTIVMGAQPTYGADGVSLDAFGSFEETSALLDYAYSNYTYRQIFYTGQIIAQYPVSGGENNVVVQPVTSQATVLPKNLDESKLTWVYGESVGTITAPVEQGQVISTLQVWYGSKCLAQTELVTVNAVAVWQEPVQHTRAEIPEELGFWGIAGIVLLVLLGLAALTFGVLLALRFISKMKVMSRRKNRRADRRRSR